VAGFSRGPGPGGRSGGVAVGDQQPPRDPLPQLPRPLKYAWGVLMTALLAASMLLEQGSIWRPLVNCSIDCLHRQRPATGNR
jgi:hypothetical protein